MKTLALVTALAAGALFAGAASANTICTGCSYGAGNTYLGSHSPTTADDSSYTHTQISRTAFTDTWLFDLSPAGDIALHATFIPTTGVTNFGVKLYGATANCGTVAFSCTNVSLGSLIAAGTSALDFVYDLGPATLSAGLYAFVVSGTSSQFGSLYSGNLTTAISAPVAPPSVPEPGSLALVGLAILGAAASRRHRAN